MPRRVVSEVLDSTYNHTTGRITLLTGIKGETEVNPPEVPVFDGQPVDDQRWIRSVTQTFTGEQLETRSPLAAFLSIGQTELIVENVERFPNSGTVAISRGASNEEIVTYTGRNLSTNTLTGLSPTTTLTHDVGDFVYPIVQVDYFGVFEVQLSNFPIRHGKVTAILNGVTTLVEGRDFTVVNRYDSSNIATRGLLKFFDGSQPRRFAEGDSLEVTYQYYVQDISQIEINTAFGQTGFVDLYSTELFETRFDDLCPAAGGASTPMTIKITPPLGNPPIPATIQIPDTEAPQGVVTTEPIFQFVALPSLQVSDVSQFPTAGTFIEQADDDANRTIIVGGIDMLTYESIDTVNNRLVGISGTLTQNYDEGAPIQLADPARYLRDTVKDAVNGSTELRAQVEALSVDNGSDRQLRLRAIVSGASLNLQPGTIDLAYIGFDDNTQRGIASDITGSIPFSGNKLTFRDSFLIRQRTEIAQSLLGQTVTRFVIS